jgi:choline dehydrogenase-like flavoprotein
MLESSVEELAAESLAAPFDAVIVGGGSAGLTTARTLAESGRRVAVLEAGPAPFLTRLVNTDLRFSRALSDDLRNQVQYAPKLPDGSPFGPNYGCLGGRGLFWNGASPRFRDHDFAGWPFNAADLAAEYAWAEREFRVSPVLGESRLAQALIAKLNQAGIRAQAAPFALDAGAVGNGRLSAGIASGLGLFLRAGAAIAAGKIRVAIDVQATSILLEDRQARGVVAVSRGGGGQQEILGRAVVLAGGGLESARLAANSRVPDPYRLIGVGIQDHLFYRAYFEGPQLYDPQTPEAAAVYVPSAAQTTEQWEIHAPGRRLLAVDDGTAWNPAPGDAYQFMVRSFAATEKQSANRLEAQPGPPGSATVHFTYSAADEQQKTRIQSNADRIAKALGLNRVDDRFAGPGGSYHEAGGLDMGTDATTSVTNPDGCFHSVTNLLCVDAAAFPRIGATNPHLTIVAVARRQALRLSARR